LHSLSPNTNSLGASTFSRKTLLHFVDVHHEAHTLRAIEECFFRLVDRRCPHSWHVGTAQGRIWHVMADLALRL
jgi:hypothetical protein